MNVKDLKNKLERASINLKGEKLISRQAMREILNVDYRYLKNATDVSDWEAIRVIHEGKVYYRFSSITDEMLENLIKKLEKKAGKKLDSNSISFDKKAQTEDNTTQTERVTVKVEKESKDRAVFDFNVKATKKQVKKENGCPITREEVEKLHSILNLLVSGFHEVCFYLSKLYFERIDSNPSDYKKLCAMWEDNYKKLKDLIENLSRRSN